MRTENRNNFSWRTVQYSRLNVHQSIKNYFDIMVDDGDGGTGGGVNGGGSGCPCTSGCTGVTFRAPNINGIFRDCFECNDQVNEKFACLPDPSGGGGNTGTTPTPTIPTAGNNPFNWGVGGTWGSLPWGNLGGIYTGGFLYPPTSVPPASYGGGSNGGGGSAPPSSTSVPPPTNLASAVDNKKPDCAGVIGGSAYRDSCKTCVGGTTKKQPCVKGCDSVWGSGAKIDSCQRCAGGTTGRKPCVKDCKNVWGGTAAKDSCGKCAGGTSGVVACNKIPCATDSTMKVTKSMLIAIYDSINYDKKHKKPGPSASAASLQRMDTVIKYMNMYMKDYGIDTRMRLSAILSQMMAETGGFTLVYEGYTYSKKNLLENHSNLFDTSNVNKYVNCLCVFDRMYANSDDGNGNEASKDGSTFRGRGFIQLTHRGSYGRFTAFYQKKYNDYNTSFINTPDLVADDLRIAVLSSLWEFCVDKAKKPFYNLKKADLDNIVGVSRAINGGDNAMDKRKAGYAKAKKALCL
jgi:predicted chitinase